MLRVRLLSGRGRSTFFLSFLLFSFSWGCFRPCLRFCLPFSCHDHCDRMNTLAHFSMTSILETFSSNLQHVNHRNRLRDHHILSIIITYNIENKRLCGMSEGGFFDQIGRHLHFSSLFSINIISPSVSYHHFYCLSHDYNFHYNYHHHHSHQYS